MHFWTPFANVTLCRVHAQDADHSLKNRRITYFISTTSALIRAKFAVERDTGSVRLMQPIDREAPGSNVYRFTVSLGVKILQVPLEPTAFNEQQF